MTLREAAQQALEAIDRALPHAPPRGEFDALADMADALRAALAELDGRQQTHSTECWRWHHECAVARIERFNCLVIESFVNAAAERLLLDINDVVYGRYPLTDDQITAINASLKIGTTTELVRAIERAHGIGGGNE